MRFSASSLLTLAFALGAAKAEEGCRVYLESNLAKPADSGEIILYGILKYFHATADVTSVSSDCCNWANTVSAPYSVLFYPNVEEGYESDAELEAVLDPWIGTYIRSESTTPDSDTNTGDYLVTYVVCS
ncbi:hypothetical protein ACMFMG_010920 [Clarireedia jacksonii]